MIPLIIARYQKLRKNIFAFGACLSLSGMLFSTTAVHSSTCAHNQADELHIRGPCDRPFTRRMLKHALYTASSPALRCK